MNITQGFSRHVLIEEIDPLVRCGAIYFPLSVQNEYIEEDGLSQGCFIDSGPYATVTFEKAVGDLADDTVDLYLRLAEENRNKVHDIHLDQFVVFKTVSGWDDDLPPMTEDELQSGYWGWSMQRREAYDKAHHRFDISGDLLIDYNGERIYQSGDQLFFQARENKDDFKSGCLMPIDLDVGVSIDGLIKIIESKQKANLQYLEDIKTLKQNFAMLATVFGYKARQ